MPVDFPRGVTFTRGTSGCSFTIHIPLGCSHLSTEELYQNNNKNISEQPSIEDQPLQHIPASIEENENSEDGTKKVIRKKHSILIVEDEDEIRNYLLTELGSHFRVLSCSNGKDTDLRTGLIQRC